MSMETGLCSKCDNPERPTVLLPAHGDVSVTLVREKCAMRHATETLSDRLHGELAHTLQMVNSLQADLERGKEPDGDDPKWTRADRGRRMTLRLVKDRLRHISIRITQALSQNDQEHPIDGV